MIALAQGFYSNMSFSGNSPGALGGPGLTPGYGMPADVEIVTITFQNILPLPSPAPGRTEAPFLPPPTPVPSPVEPGAPGSTQASPGSAAPVPTGGDASNDCSRCSIYFQYVNVYYWPAASSNTDCLSIVSSHTQTPMPLGYTPYLSTWCPLENTLLIIFLACRLAFMLFSPQSVPAILAQKLESHTMIM